jgi:hypothetical protein
VLAYRKLAKAFEIGPDELLDERDPRTEAYDRAD